ncbi:MULTISPECIES: tyrosine-protein kinase domain-containing protein [unclassified Rhizobium]|uniref:GumC family protein n=1 Tax=unclassified Rhizobium TaxID=2613769 RepID=UPI0006F494A3|nr:MULTISPECIES: tyrosine-protein kinase domain-containing protein [unclassified Rhizobium]KQV33569.1 hypothetical protein ASC86_16335 [Rhizobium sp. Root1212]KRD23113.1 hypothetical protein ASE37_16255 [Rhizobium sp. Root268]
MNSAVFAESPAGTGRLAGGNPLVIVWRRRGLFILAAAVVFAAAMLALVTLPVRYLASGSIIVAEPETGLSYPPAGWAQKVGDPADLESQLLMVRSPRILRKVMDAPGVADLVATECAHSFKIPFVGTPCSALQPGSAELLDYLQARYSFIGAGRSRVITIGYSSFDPDIARDMANVLINVFLEDHRRGLMENRSTAAKSLEEEMLRLDGEIARADAEIQAYRSEKGLMQGANASVTSERLTTISQQLASAETARDAVEAILSTVKSGGNVAALPAVLESRAVADIKQRLAMASEEAEAAAVVLGPRHPRLRSLQGQVATLKHGLDAEIRIVVASAEKRFDAASETAKALRTQMDKAKTDVSASLGDETAIEQMVRDVGVKRAQYAALYDKRKGLESEERAMLGSTRLVSLAERPLKRFFPKTAPFVAGGAALALMAGVGAALLRDRWQPAAPDGTRPVGPAIIARFPKTAGTGDLRYDLAAAADNPTVQVALKRLLADIEGRCRSVLLLSAFAGQGRSFTAMALATAAADAGRRVLLVEGDMRAPQLGDAFGVHPRVVLQDVLEGRAVPQAALIRLDAPGVDVIAAGPAATDPADLLAGPGMAGLLDWAKSYDLVVFDSPALDRHMDAGLIAVRVDGVLCCTGEDDLRSAEMIVRRLGNLGANMLGLVSTQARLAEREIPQSMETGHRRRM